MKSIRWWGRGRLAGFCAGALLVAASVGQVASANSSYVIEPGDTLSGIAVKFDVSTSKLASVNGIANPDLIIMGNQLTIPNGNASNSGGSTATVSQAQGESESTSSGAAYLVVKGDSIPAIAAQYGLTPSELADANGIPYPWLIHPGDVLLIPGVESASSSQSVADVADEPQGGTGGGGISYVVTQGDSLPGIAATFGLTPNQVAQANGLSYPWLIHPGDELLIPVVEEPSLPVGESAQDSDSVSTQDPYTGDVLDYELPAYSQAEVRSMLVDAANMYDWDPYLIMAQAWWESHWNQQTVSWANAIGIMQILPSTAKSAGPYLLGRDVDIFNSGWDNIELGVAYLEHLYEQTGSEYLALASYYQGLYSVQEDGIFPETYTYVDGIFELRDSFASGQLP